MNLSPRIKHFKKSPKKCTSLVLLWKKEKVPGPPPFQSPTFMFGIAEVPLITKYLPCESFVRRCHRKVLTLQEVAWCISYLWIWSTCWDPVSTKVGEKTSSWFELKIKDLNGTWSWDIMGLDTNCIRSGWPPHQHGRLPNPSDAGRTGWFWPSSWQGAQQFKE